MGCICTNKSDMVVKRTTQSVNQPSKREADQIQERNAQRLESKKDNSRKEPQRSTNVNLRNEIQEQKYIHSEGNPRNNLNPYEIRKEINHSSLSNQREINPSVIPEVIRSVINRHESSNEPYMNSRVNPDFNFREIDKVYVGSGLKRMKGYISHIPPEELEKKRQAFWETRVEGNPETWQFLRTICGSREIGDGDIHQFLLAAGVTPVKNCINATYDTTGAIYEIPNYCINDPFKYDIVDQIVHIKQRPNEKLIDVIIRNFDKEKKYKIKNTSTILDLKTLITKNPLTQDEVIAIEQIRFFFGGKELMNEEELWCYNIDDRSIVNMMLRQFKQ